MKLLLLAILVTVLACSPALAQNPEGGLAKIKEQELEEVRDRIADLKKSMDASAAARDRLTRDLQAAEELIAEKRMRLKELERQRDYSARRKTELEQRLADREAELDEESRELADQVRSAYMSGRQERIRLLLSQ
jgi:septal ring factor EnvC (AmiA/AmiB activator)